MTIPESVHLVLQASSMGHGGEVFLLNIGQQVKIHDLAEDLIKLSGLEPHRDIEITFTGIRPGEKLSEELWEEGIRFQPTQHSEIYRAVEEEDVDGLRLKNAIDEFAKLAAHSETEAIINLLDDAIPSAAVRSSPPPDITSII